MLNKKTVAILAAGTLGLSLAACSGGSGSGEAGASADTLTILTLVQAGTEGGDFLDEFVKEFEADTGATVKITRAGEDIPDVYETSAAGGKEADVVMVNLAEKSTTWVEQGIAIPASDYIDEWGLRDKINPDALEAWTDVEGNIQGFPYDGFTWPVWYNMELLARAGITEVPTTVDALMGDVVSLTEAGVPVMVTGGNDWSGNKLFLQIIQSYMSEDETKEVFSQGNFCENANAMKGIELFAELRDAGLFIKDVEGYTADQMNATFYEGQAAIMSAGSWAFGPTPEGLRENVTLGGFPVPEGGTYSKPTAFDGYTGQGFWISRNGAADDKIELVREFITRWYTPEVASAWSATTNGPTAVIMDGEGVEIANSLTAQAVNDLPGLVEFAVMPDTVVPGAVSDPLIRETSLAFRKGTAPEAICASLDAVYP